MNYSEDRLFGKEEPALARSSAQGHMKLGPQRTKASIESRRTGEQGAVPLSYRFLFSLPILGLFIQWLMPLKATATLPDTFRLLTSLMVMAGALMFWGMLQLPGWLLLSVQLQIIMLTWVIVCAWGQGLQWAGRYAAEIPDDLMNLITGYLSELGGDTRVLILMLGWGLLVSSVQHLALFRGSTVLFTGITILYLLGLDIGYGMDTAANLVISSALILWMQGLSRLLSLKEQAVSNGIPYARWGMLALIAAACVTGTAWAGEQLLGFRSGSSEAFESVISRLESWGQEHFAERMEKPQTGNTGYGYGEGELGSPLVRNTDLVFTADSSERTYWRGESLAYYDGRRWIRGAADFTALTLSRLPGVALPPSGLSEGRRLIQRIEFAVPSSGGLPLFSAGTVTQVEEVRLAGGSRMGYVLANKAADGFRLPEMTASSRILGYTVESLLPESRAEVLRNLRAQDPVDIQSKYLQLPPGLPERIFAYAESLTASAGNRYDASAAVRDALQSGYTYTLKTRIPPPGADFTDDFLFSTREGYCVHFATAMTILLRASGIPARYVQGYGPGTPEGGSSAQRYVVTQADAHAWVEVYFPGAGWIPFDPTPGTAASGGAAEPVLSAAAEAAPRERSAPAAQPAGELPALPPAGGDAPAPLAAAALLVSAAWRWRRSLLVLAMRSTSSRERQLRAASLAWRGLAARYGPPPPGMTGREYADSLPIQDARLRATVGQFVRQWELLAYGEAAAGTSGAAFMRECLRITFRVA